MAYCQYENTNGLRGESFTSSLVALADCWRRMLHTVHQLVRAGSHHGLEDRTSLLSEEDHSLREHPHTEVLVAGSPAAGRILVIDHTADSRVEGMSSSEDTDCMGLTCLGTM